MSPKARPLEPWRGVEDTVHVYPQWFDVGSAETSEGLNKLLQKHFFSPKQAGTMSKLPKFEIELPAAPKSTKLSLSERDIAMATMYVCPLGEFLLVIAFSPVMIGGCCKHTGAALAPVASEHTRRTLASPLPDLKNVESSSFWHSFLILLTLWS